MRKIFLLLFIITFNSLAQDLAKVDEEIYAYPNVESYEELAKKIDLDFSSDLEKIKAAYTWVALNIEYYEKETNLLTPPKFLTYYGKEDLKRREKKENEKLISKTFKTRKAVCEGYARLFKKICDLLAIDNALIKGYVKTESYEIGHLQKTKNHIWNAVKLEGKWILIDVTFGSGYSLNGAWKTRLDNYYFDIKKEELNKSHYPSEKKWLDFMEQIPLKQFSNKPIFKKQFFVNNLELISPKEGEIIIPKREKIILKLKGVKSNMKISYSFGIGNKSKSPFIKNKESYTEIVINNPSKDSNLNIYFNHELALQYKVLVR